MRFALLCFCAGNFVVLGLVFAFCVRVLSRLWLVVFALFQKKNYPFFIHPQYTPLFLAVIHLNLRAIRKLVQHGASVDVVDEMGRTPIHWAVLDGIENPITLKRRAVIRELVELGAKVTSELEEEGMIKRIDTTSLR
jgi:ankyrin repeat protein